MALQATFCRHCGVAMGMSHAPLGDCGKRDKQHGYNTNTTVTYEDDKKDKKDEGKK